MNRVELHIPAELHSRASGDNKGFCDAPQDHTTAKHSENNRRATKRSMRITHNTGTEQKRIETGFTMDASCVSVQFHRVMHMRAQTHTHTHTHTHIGSGRSTPVGKA